MILVLEAPQGWKGVNLKAQFPDPLMLLPSQGLEESPPRLPVSHPCIFQPVTAVVSGRISLFPPPAPNALIALETVDHAVGPHSWVTRIPF